MPFKDELLKTVAIIHIGKSVCLFVMSEGMVSVFALESRGSVSISAQVANGYRY